MFYLRHISNARRTMLVVSDRLWQPKCGHYDKQKQVLCNARAAFMQDLDHFAGAW